MFVLAKDKKTNNYEVLNERYHVIDNYEVVEKGDFKHLVNTIKESKLNNQQELLEDLVDEAIIEISKFIDVVTDVGYNDLGRDDFVSELMERILP